MAQMIEDPFDYFRQFLPARDAILKRLEAEAKQGKIPIIGPLVGEMLYLLAAAAKARKILELGTATGYSGIYLARAAVQNGGFLTTLEWDLKLAQAAAANFKEAGLSDHVEIRVGEAQILLETLTGPYDFIFMDIDKEFYAQSLTDCRRLLKTGGMMVVDNTGFKDADEFNRKIFSLSGWRVVNIYGFLPQHSPEMDGLCLALAV
jgi:predicted O-methyltransferase YrrM